MASSNIPMPPTIKFALECLHSFCLPLSASSALHRNHSSLGFSSNMWSLLQSSLTSLHENFSFWSHNQYNASSVIKDFNVAKFADIKSFFRLNQVLHPLTRKTMALYCHIYITPPKILFHSTTHTFWTNMSIKIPQHDNYKYSFAEIKKIASRRELKKLSLSSLLGAKCIGVQHMPQSMQGSRK